MVGTDPRGRFSLILVFVTLEGHLRPLLALLLPQRRVKALAVRVGHICEREAKKPLTIKTMALPSVEDEKLKNLKANPV